MNIENNAEKLMIPDSVKERLRQLADKYETPSFSEGDPSGVLRRYSNQSDIESAAFIAAVLSFGRREQFLAKLEIILKQADEYGGPCLWLKSGKYKETFHPDLLKEKESFPTRKFYRFYSYNDMLLLFTRLAEILSKNETLGEYFFFQYSEKKQTLRSVGAVLLGNIICDSFTGCTVVPQCKDSANKRVNMFLRWMVRSGSPVDLGLWTWYSPADLIIPLDTHVLQEAKKLGLLPEKCTANYKTAIFLTGVLKQIWPDDPCKGDYALFGLGV